ncbi:MAG: hypothetical protein ACP5IL_15845, partial [Syntrophobacteraceae bacterium]
MSVYNSNLCSEKYGYDFVVATTQASIDATMNQYLSCLGSPEVIMCYTQDDTGAPVLVDYAKFIKNAGVDPFTVADGTQKGDKSLQVLEEAYFYYAFKAKIGLPSGYTSQAMPKVVELGTNTASVTYRLMCSEFIVVEATYGPKGITGWLNKSQPDGNAWIFASKVDLRLTEDLGTAYHDLPADVKERIKNLGPEAFSIQQLLFDLDNAALQTVPTLEGVEPGTPLHTCLENVFQGAYFSSLQKHGQPVLSYSVKRTVKAATPSPTIDLTDLNFEVNKFIDKGQQAVLSDSQQQGLATLCYLCAANSNILPAAVPFTWNWVEPAEENTCCGAMAINSDIFIRLISDLLSPVLGPLCKRPYCNVSTSGLSSTITLRFDPDTDSQSYTIVKDRTVGSDGFARVLTFSNTNSGHDSGAL